MREFVDAPARDGEPPAARDRRRRLGGLRARPTETLSGVALGSSVYGFATQVQLPPVVAAGLAVVAAFGPLVVSRFVDALRG